MKNLLQSELRKLIYLRANWLLLLWSGLFAGLGTVAPIMVLNSETRGMGMGFSGTNTPEGINAVFANAAGGYLFALIMGILIMTNEYRHGTAVGTFLVTPKRSTVLLAKLIAASFPNHSGMGRKRFGVTPDSSGATDCHSRIRRCDRTYYIIGPGWGHG